MNDFERQISDALHAAADSARPGGNLTERVIRRHRRYRLRQAAGGAVAVALVVAVPLSVPSLRSGGNGVPAAPAVARPGTVLRDCQDQFVDGNYGPRWQAHSLRAGPLWFVQARPAYVTGSTGTRPFGELPVIIRDGGYAAVTVAGPSRGTFRFFYGPGLDGDRFTLRDGSAGVTFAACGPGHDESGQPGYTVFWGLFIVARFPACVSLNVWTMHARQPVRVTLPIDTSCRS